VNSGLKSSSVCGNLPLSSLAKLQFLGHKGTLSSLSCRNQTMEAENHIGAPSTKLSLTATSVPNQCIGEGKGLLWRCETTILGYQAYLIDEVGPLLARGQAGDVFECLDYDSWRSCVIKVSRIGCNDWKRESNTLGWLRHHKSPCEYKNFFPVV
jgi:hypothetical protein